MENIKIIILCVWAVMSIIGFLSMVIDKSKARNGKWRTKESVLLLIGFLMGGVGSCLAMYLIRHKNRKPKFVIWLPIFALLNIAIVVTSLVLL